MVFFFAPAAAGKKKGNPTMTDITSGAIIINHPRSRRSHILAGLKIDSKPGPTAGRDGPRTAPPGDGQGIPSPPSLPSGRPSSAHPTPRDPRERERHTQKGREARPPPLHPSASAAPPPPSPFPARRPNFARRPAHTGSCKGP